MSLTTTNLLTIKFYLEKYAKLRNLESYTLTYIYELWDMYKDYLKNNKNTDIEFPGYNIKLN